MGDKFMPEIHLKQPGFTYSACGQSQKTNKELKSLCRLEIQTLFIKLNLIKHVFRMIWPIANQKIQQKEPKRTQLKVLRDKAFKIASDPKYDGYQKGLASMIYKFLDKKSASLNKSSGRGIVNEPNSQLANELHKSIIRKF